MPLTVATTTATALPSALTTPYIWPPACTPFQSLTTYPSSNYRGGSTSTVTALLSDPAVPRFSACMPTGWDSLASSPQFTFSPAVCPGGWTAQEMATAGGSLPDISTAWCCAESHTLFITNLEFSLSPLTALCTRAFTGPYTYETTTYDTASPTIPITTTLTATGPAQHIHPAWNIAWQASDTPVLSPRPPDLGTEGMLIYTWVPDRPLQSDVDYVLLHRDVNELKGLQSVFYFVVIGVPLIALALIGCCCWCCVSHRRTKRRERQRRAALASNGGVQNESGEPNTVP